MNHLLIAITLAMWPSCAAAQSDQAERRIRIANDKVDGLIASVDPRQVQPHVVEQELKNLLAAALYEGQPPSIYVTNHPQNGRFLVAAYTLDRGYMGPGGTAVTLRTYTVSGGRFTLADVAGNDMDGYGNVAVKQLHSPKQGEVWLLLWGQMTGANGPNIRMRVLASDGKELRSVWMPENAWGSFEVKVTPRGFTVEGEYYRERNVRRDAYFVAEDGLYRQTR